MASPNGEWSPANDVEAALLRALADGDQRAYFSTLLSAPLYLPTTQQAQQRYLSGQGLPPLYVLVIDGVRVIPAYTSVEALARDTAGAADAYAEVTYDLLAQHWPDPDVRIAIDPDLPVGVLAGIADLAAGARGDLTIPSLAELDAAAVARLTPANEVETRLRAARSNGDVPGYLEALGPADVLVPVTTPVPDPDHVAWDEFPWWPLREGEQTVIAVFTSPQRLAEGWTGDGHTATVPFISVLQFFPDAEYTLVVNRASPLEFALPGHRVRELFAATAQALTGAAPPPPAAAGAPPVILLQKVLAPGEAQTYLEQGRTHVTGFVHPVDELREFRTPAALRRALGLAEPDTGVPASDEHVHILRWLAHCPILYRLTVGGPDEQTLLANEGWMLEPPPFRGDGLAAGEALVPQLAVNSVVLPHGSMLVELTSMGHEVVVATFDADLMAWTPGGHPAATAPPTVVNGYLARWQGNEFEASPDGHVAVRLYGPTPAPGFEEVATGRYRRVVARAEVEWLGYARTLGLWRDLPVLVVAEHGEHLWVEYLGGLGPAALAAGLTRTEPGVYQGWVPRSEVLELQVVRTP